MACGGARARFPRIAIEHPSRLRTQLKMSSATPVQGRACLPARQPRSHDDHNTLQIDPVQLLIVPSLQSPAGTTPWIALGDRPACPAGRREPRVRRPHPPPGAPAGRPQTYSCRVTWGACLPAAKPPCACTHAGRPRSLLRSSVVLGTLKPRAPFGRAGLLKERLFEARGMQDCAQYGKSGQRLYLGTLARGMQACAQSGKRCWSNACRRLEVVSPYGIERSLQRSLATFTLVGEDLLHRRSSPCCACPPAGRPACRRAGAMCSKQGAFVFSGACINGLSLDRARFSILETNAPPGYT